MFQWNLQLLNHIPRLVNFVIFNNILFVFQNYDQVNELILSLKSGKFIIENSKNYLDYTVCTLNVRHDIFTITGLLLSANYLETRRSFLLLAQVKSTFALEEKKLCQRNMKTFCFDTAVNESYFFMTTKLCNYKLNPK